MNIEQAKAIPLSIVLEKMGSTPAKEAGQDVWYHSPLRKERTPSLHIHSGRNVWYDFGEEKGGNGIDLVCAYLKNSSESSTIVDALRWLRNMAGNGSPGVFHAPIEKTPKNEGWLLKKEKPIEHIALIRYLEKRGIPLSLARKRLTEVHAHMSQSGKTIFALGFCNEDGGYELRNPFFKGCIAPKTVTFIRGIKPKPESIHIFEGFMDYLSAAASCKKEQLEGDSIVLNSLSCLKDAWPYIKGYGYGTVFSWMDNDTAGNKASKALAEFVKTEADLLHKPMNSTYAPHKDVNAWRMHQLGLSL